MSEHRRVGESKEVDSPNVCVLHERRQDECLRLCVSGNVANGGKNGEQAERPERVLPPQMGCSDKSSRGQVVNACPRYTLGYRMRLHMHCDACVR